MTINFLEMGESKMNETFYSNIGARSTRRKKIDNKFTIHCIQILHVHECITPVFLTDHIVLYWTS